MRLPFITILVSLPLLFNSCQNSASSNEPSENDGDDNQEISENTVTIKEITIGNQTWMEENLSVSQFQNGDVIQEVTSEEEWNRAIENEKPAWCYYDFNSKNGDLFGKIYNWYALNDSRELAPEGWYIPDENDWTTLMKELGGSAKAGAKLKATELWAENYSDKEKGTNESGFSALPGGNYQGGFDWIHEAAIWWCKLVGDQGPAKFYILQYGEGMETDVSWENINTGSGLYVRCIKK